VATAWGVSMSRSGRSDRSAGASRLHPTALVLAVLLALSAGGVHAAMFEDEDARNAILELRSRAQSRDDFNRARLTELAAANAALQEQVQQLRRSLLDLNSQLEMQRVDSAKLRGGQEQLTRNVTDLQLAVKDGSKALDDRLRVLEPQRVTLDGKEFGVGPDERQAHDQAMAALRAGDFDKAAIGLGGLLLRYPATGYAESARFWLGNALYGQKSYKEAIAVFKVLVTSSPNHLRAPEALLAIANCQIEMKDNRAARKTIEELLKIYPTSDAAMAGRDRLSGLKG
jgi:tol-pal system protein YbgF